MRTCVIRNPLAGRADATGWLDSAVAERGWVLLDSDGPGHAELLASEAVADGFDCVVAAGGDGTIHEVVNGMAGDLDAASLGILPLGTGNDLARTLGIPVDPRAALDALGRGSRRMDLIRATSEDRRRVAVNSANCGFAGEVDRELTPEIKRVWGPLAYLRGTAAALSRLEPFAVTIDWGHGEVQEAEALNLLVANGRTVAGGFPVAPDARMDDGLLDVVVVLGPNLLDAAGLSALLIAGSYLDSDKVVHRKVRGVGVGGAPAFPVNLDGELWTDRPVRFEVLPSALLVRGLGSSPGA
ncbi:MAG: diacylglycerol/lipid kinase family protein [Myxococcota bacterium]